MKQVKPSFRLVLKSILNISLLTCIFGPVIAFLISWIFVQPIQECLFGSYVFGLALSIYFVSTKS